MGWWKGTGGLISGYAVPRRGPGKRYDPAHTMERRIPFTVITDAKRRKTGEFPISLFISLIASSGADAAVAMCFAHHGLWTKNPCERFLARERLDQKWITRLYGRLFGLLFQTRVL